MTTGIDGFALWLADFYLAATILLILAGAALRFIKQPARRMAVHWGMLVSLFLAGVLSLSASRPRVDLRSLLTGPERPPVRVETTRPQPIETRVAAIPFAPQQTAPLPQPNAARPVDVVVPTKRYVEPPSRRPIDLHAVLSAGVFVFLAGVVLMAARLGVGVWQASRLIRKSRTAPPTLVDELRDIIGGTARAPRLRLSGLLLTPVASGALRPTIVLPERFCENSSRAGLRTVLAHEWAHIRNGDLWLLALDRCLLPVLWTHPAYWWLRRQMRQDQELLADAAAASLVGTTHYAGLLVEWAKGVRMHRVSISGAVGIWERPSALSQRVSSILNQSERMALRCSGRARVTVVISLAALSLLAASISVRPPLARSAPPETKESAAKTKPEPAKADGFRVGPDEIGGTCLDSEKNPLSGAEVSLFVIDDRHGSQTRLQTSTNDAGQFHFRKVPPFQGGRNPQRRYLLTARKPGRASAFRRAQPGEWADLVLPKPVTFQGTVKDRKGKPVSGALVCIGRVIPFDAYPLQPTEGLRCSRTDANGKFLLDDVVEYQFVDRVSRGYSRGLHGTIYGTIRLGPPWFTVDHPDFVRTMVPFTKLPGRADVTLTKGATLTGKVVRADTGKPAEGVTVWMQGINKQNGAARIMSGLRAKTDAGGRYRFASLPGGEFNVFIDSRGLDATAVALDSFEVREAQANQAPPIRLIRGGLVKGRVIDDLTGKPVVRDEDEFLDVQIYGPSRPQSGAACEVVEIKHDGTFEIRLPPGRNSLTLRADNKTEVFEGTGDDGGYVTVPDGGEVTVKYHVKRLKPPKKLPDRKTQNDASLSVRVVDAGNQPVGRASVVACVRNEKAISLEKYEATTDAAGIASLDVRGRLCRMLAFNEEGTLAGQAAVGSEARQATIRLVPAATVTGRLVTQSFVPISDQRMQCYLTEPDDAQTMVALETRTGSGGDFRFAGIPVGAKIRLITLKSGQLFYHEDASFVAARPEKVDRGELLELQCCPRFFSDQHNDHWLPAPDPRVSNDWDRSERLDPELTRAYGLDAGTNVKRVSEPFPKGRSRWAGRSTPGEIHSLMLHFHNGRFLGQWQSHIDGRPEMQGACPLISILEGCGLGANEIVGPRKLLDRRVVGDIIIRVGVPAEKLIPELEQILWKDGGPRVQLNFVDESQRVFVAKGRFSFNPIDARLDSIALYSNVVPAGLEQTVGGGNGGLDDLLRDVGKCIDQRIVNEVSTPPIRVLSWNRTRQTEGAPAAELVLNHLTEQTGLTFHEATRTVRVLRVE